MAGINWDTPGKQECMITLFWRAPSTSVHPPTDTASSAAFSSESWFFFYVQQYHTQVGKAGVLHATSKPFLLLLLLKTPNSLDSMPLDFRPRAPASHGCSGHFPFTFWGCRHALYPYSVLIYRNVNIQSPHLFSSNGMSMPSQPLALRAIL